MYTGIVSFALTIMIILCIQLKQPISFAEGFAAGLAIYIGILLITYVDREMQLHSKILWPARRYLQFFLSSVVIEEWNVDVNISSNGDAEIVHDFRGKVNFGANKWIEIGVQADGKQPCGQEFPILVTNMDTGVTVDPKILVDYPKYKKLRIHFDRPLCRGEKFHYKIEYQLAKTFFFNRDDYYEQHATHFEKRINARINFDKTIDVQRVWGTIVTQHGEEWPIGKDQPHLSQHLVKWSISKAYMGHLHRLWWACNSTSAKEPAHK